MQGFRTYTNISGDSLLRASLRGNTETQVRMLAEARTRRLASSAHRCVWTPSCTHAKDGAPHKGARELYTEVNCQATRGCVPSSNGHISWADESATVHRISLLSGLERPAGTVLCSAHTCHFALCPRLVHESLRCYSTRHISKWSPWHPSPSPSALGDPI